MNRNLFAISTLMLLFAFVACTPEHNNGEDSGNQNNPGIITVTGEALNVTDHAATLIGYANLPSELKYAEMGIMYDKSQSFEDAKMVAATELDGNNKFTVSASFLSASTTYYYKSYVQDGESMKYGAVKSFKTEESKSPAGSIDLGVVMKKDDGTTYVLYWAECNLGATKPEDFGDYYAWGETETKKDYSWSTYKWSTVTGKLIKYCPIDKFHYWGTTSYWDTSSPDNKIVLDPEDDVAHVKLGNKWRIPTNEEWTELEIQGKWEMTTYSGVKGMKVTGPNGNCIFLPAAGFRYEKICRNDRSSFVHYWSSSLFTDNPTEAWFAYDIPDEYFMGKARFCGLSIRPVTE